MAERKRHTARGGFAAGLVEHYSQFQQTMQAPQDLFVEIRLVTGQVFGCKGLSIRHGPLRGCVMIHGAPTESERALVVREDHIVSAEIMMPPPSEEAEFKLPFGFAAGSAHDR